MKRKKKRERERERERVEAKVHPASDDAGHRRKSGKIKKNKKKAIK